MPTEDAMRGPYVETSRLRYDNGARWPLPRC